MKAASMNPMGGTSLFRRSVALVAVFGQLALPALGASPPVPKPKPGVPSAVAAADDPIGAMIRGDDDTGEKTSEDSDAPQVSAPRAPPPKLNTPPASGKDRIGAAGFTIALQFLDRGDPAAATLAAYALPDKVDIKIIDWLVATGGYSGVPSSRIAEVSKRLADWPGQALLRIRYEQAIAQENPGTASVIKVLGGKTPASADGTIILARAYLDAGRKSDAAAIIRAYWRKGGFGEDTEARIRSEFGSLLTAADHKARMDRLLYDEQTAAALREANVLGKEDKLLATFVTAVIRKSKGADKALAAVPKTKQKDPLFVYARIQLLRRAGKIDSAAALMLSAPRDPAALVDPDAWWIERRLISRSLLETGDYRTAYRIAAGHSAESGTLRAEAEFHAGWYALAFLNDPAAARPHFEAIEAASSLPLTQSRAEYWLGRTEAAAGNAAAAAAHFKLAAAYPTTFYGQLALARLGAKRLDLKTPAPPTDEVRARFNSRELVQVIRHLTAANHDDRVDIFYRTLAETLSDPTEIALLCALAEANDEHQIGLQIGKVAASRGLPVDTLAFPTAAIPSSAKVGLVERPVVYAIARQESAFNHRAVSQAGARGLLQLMPATAKQTAGMIGIPYSRDGLTDDPAYNATLGAAHLGQLLEDFGGSYVMTFASYNAGKSRVLEWVKAHGDPRDPKTDVVNWIELIPFTETRNYVQRTMENLQVYRARLGAPALTIDADLKYGRIVKVN